MDSEKNRAKVVISEGLTALAEKIYRASEKLSTGSEDDITFAIGLLGRAETLIFDAKQSLAALLDEDLSSKVSDIMDGDIDA